MNQDNRKEEGNIHSNTQESMRMENDILKLKMQAEFGATFGSFANLSPEAEHDFLQMVMAFEKMEKDATIVSVFEFIGKPHIRPLEEIPVEEWQDGLEQLQGLLSNNGICLEVSGKISPEVLYRFITDELLQHEIQDIRIPGMVCVFYYEDFHPNHLLELEEASAEIFSCWQKNTLDALSSELAEFGVLPNGSMLTREQIRYKMKEQRARYGEIQQLDFTIGNRSFEWMEEGLGLGFTEGVLKFQGQAPEGTYSIEGAFKFYFCNQGAGWQLTFLYLPGFEW